MATAVGGIHSFGNGAGAYFEKPSFTMLRLWLERAEAEGLVEVSGTGRKEDAFRYRLPGAPATVEKQEGASGVSS